MVYKFVERKLTNLESLWDEISPDLGLINELVEKIRTKIVEAINSPENLTGFLRGSVDDYMKDFAAETRKI